MTSGTIPAPKAIARALPARDVLMTGFLLTLAILMSGCNTVEGVGQDMQSGGRAVENSAEDAAQ